jgi:hypothetical protein
MKVPVVGRPLRRQTVAIMVVIAVTFSTYSGTDEAEAHTRNEAVEWGCQRPNPGISFEVVDSAPIVYANVSTWGRVILAKREAPLATSYCVVTQKISHHGYTTWTIARGRAVRAEAPLHEDEGDYSHFANVPRIRALSTDCIHSRGVISAASTLWPWTDMATSGRQTYCP